MNGFLIASLVLLLCAAGLLWGAWSSSQRHKHLTATESVDLGTLRELHRAASAAAGPGAFRQVVDVVGTAQPGPDGLLEAPLSGAECVWHKHSVVRRYEVVELEDGKRTTKQREETESDLTTETPFLLRDASGEVLVVPSRKVDRAEQSVDEYERAAPYQHRNTKGWKRCEWVVRPGTRLFVHGEAVDRGGALVLVEPEGRDKLLVSTRSEAEVLAGAASGHKWMRIGAIAAAAVAVVLGVVGLIA